MKSLSGKTILITRRVEQSEELVEEIERRGGTAVVLPMLRILDPEDWNPCDAALDALQTFDAVIFTSTNAVTQVIERMRLRGIPVSHLSDVNVFAVGGRTKLALEAFEIAVREVPERFNAGALLKTFGGTTLSGKRHFLPQSNIGRKELYEGLNLLGADVTTAIVYRNLPSDESVKKELKRRFTKGEFDVAAFASPSAVRRFAEVISPEEYRVARPRVLFAVIGPTTRQAAIGLGFPVDIEADVSTSAGFARAIEQYYLKSAITQYNSPA